MSEQKTQNRRVTVCCAAPYRPTARKPVQGEPLGKVFEESERNPTHLTGRTSFPLPSTPKEETMQTRSAHTSHFNLGVIGLSASKNTTHEIHSLIAC